MMIGRATFNVATICNHILSFENSFCLHNLKHFPISFENKSFMNIVKHHCMLFPHNVFFSMLLWPCLMWLECTLSSHLLCLQVRVNI
jgi:hypothetical protein